MVADLTYPCYGDSWIETSSIHAMETHGKHTSPIHSMETHGYRPHLCMPWRPMVTYLTYSCHGDPWLQTLSCHAMDTDLIYPCHGYIPYISIPWRPIDIDLTYACHGYSWLQTSTIHAMENHGYRPHLSMPWIPMVTDLI